MAFNVRVCMIPYRMYMSTVENRLKLFLKSKRVFLGLKTFDSVLKQLKITKNLRRRNPCQEDTNVGFLSHSVELMPRQARILSEREYMK